MYICMRICGRACDEQEENRNAKDDDNEALRRMRVCERGGGGGQERLYVRSGGIDGATVAKGLRNRGAKWYRDDVFSPTVGRLAKVVRRLGSAAVGMGEGGG